MLQEVVIHQSQNLVNKKQKDEALSEPMPADQMLDFCEEADLFADTIRTSEASSCSGCYGNGDGNDNDKDKESGQNICCFDEVSFTSSVDPFASMDASALSALLDDQTLDNSTLDCSSPPSQPTTAPPFGSQTCLQENPQSQMEQQVSAADLVINCCPSVFASGSSTMPQFPFLGSQPPPLTLPPIPDFEEDSIVSTLSGYLGLDVSVPPPPPCSLVNQTGMFFPGNLGVPVAGEVMFPEGFMLGSDTMVQVPENIDYQAESGGRYGMGNNQKPMVYGSGELQSLGDGNHLAGTTGCSSPTALVTDIPSLEDSTFKVGRISPEEKQQKILKYLRKRHERNFSKKIKYACRKTLADSRPRVRGRFAKNDELAMETRRSDSAKHDDEDDEVMTKEEEFMEPNDVMVDLNPFKCNYAIDHWV